MFPQTRELNDAVAAAERFASSLASQLEAAISVIHQVNTSGRYVLSDTTSSVAITWSARNAGPLEVTISVGRQLSLAPF